MEQVEQQMEAQVEETIKYYEDSGLMELYEKQGLSSEEVKKGALVIYESCSTALAGILLSSGYNGSIFHAFFGLILGPKTQPQPSNKKTF